MNIEITAEVTMEIGHGGVRYASDLTIPLRSTTNHGITMRIAGLITFDFGALTVGPFLSVAMALL
jgi:hypothetical protein